MYIDLFIMFSCILYIHKKMQKLLGNYFALNKTKHKSKALILEKKQQQMLTLVWTNQLTE